ncbi:MAG: 2-(3-amino-3-carboxypropyl)histidine synthase subunit [Nanoarchaeota archaeon]|nr:2-(3-amino-3-carboxypropyl)histidine synthase subunit [Nanoarchaeota archaeon]
MKILHIEARSDTDLLPVVREAFRFLKGSVAIVSTIQHIHKLEGVVRFMADNKIPAKVYGQVLGCSVPKIPDSVQQVLYIGSGRFHPIGIFLKTKKEVIAADPLSGRVSKITEKDVEALQKRRKGALAKFLTSESIGILISTKPGQIGVQGGEKRIKEIQKKHNDKKFYLFAFETLDRTYLDNFPFIECWVNTACPRIFEDYSKGMVNLEDI